MISITAYSVIPRNKTKRKTVVHNGVKIYTTELWDIIHFCEESVKLGYKTFIKYKINFSYNTTGEITGEINCYNKEKILWQVDNMVFQINYIINNGVLR